MHYKREDYSNFLAKEDMLVLIKPVNKKEEDIIRVPFTRDQIARYFGIVNDMEDLKRRIIYGLEQAYIKD